MNIQAILEHCNAELEWVASCRKDMESGIVYADGDIPYFEAWEKAHRGVLEILTTQEGKPSKQAILDWVWEYYGRHDGREHFEAFEKFLTAQEGEQDGCKHEAVYGYGFWKCPDCGATGYTAQEVKKINRCVHKYSKQTKIPTCVYCGKKEGE